MGASTLHYTAGVAAPEGAAHHGHGVLQALTPTRCAAQESALQPCLEGREMECGSLAQAINEP